MIRLLNLVAIGALVASAIYAYSIKYQTMFRAETVARLRTEIKTEQDRIGTLRADWAALTRPERVQAMADKLTDLQPLKLDQIVRLDALPDKAPRGDVIGRKLEDLGLAEPTSTPGDAAPSSATPAAAMPAARTPSAKPPSGITPAGTTPSRTGSSKTPATKTPATRTAGAATPSARGKGTR